MQRIKIRIKIKKGFSDGPADGIHGIRRRLHHRPLRTADSEQALEQVRVEFLGQKKGRLRELQTLIGKADKEQRPVLGKKFNEVKERVRCGLREAQAGTPKTANRSRRAWMSRCRANPTNKDAGIR